MRPTAECPCGSSDPFGRCCLAVHSGQRLAATAETLMRSRYSAYAVGVRKELERSAGHSVSRRALYRTFDRLEAKGYLEWEMESGSPVPETGGHPMRRFRVTRAGLEALQASRTALINLWSGLEGVLDKP